MSLTREDMLRELELLPAWRPRIPAATYMPASGSVEKPSGISVAEPVVEETMELVTEVAQAAPEVTSLLPDSQEVASAVPVETSVAGAVSEPLTQAAWFLLCPQAGDDASQSLLQNIMRALKLPAEDVLLHQQHVSVVQVQSRFCVLFGLEAANYFLGTTHADIASVRGQLLTYGDMCYVITHHPQAMLAQPLLKKEVWHDLCLLLAEK